MSTPDQRPPLRGQQQIQQVDQHHRSATSDQPRQVEHHRAVRVMIFPLLLIFVTLLGYFLPHSLQGAAQRNQLFPLLNTDSSGQLNGR